MFEAGASNTGRGSLSKGESEMRQSNWVLVAILVSLATVLPAQAIPFTTSQAVPFSGTPNFTQLLNFNQFDTLGGTRTLLSLEVVLNLNVDGGQLVLDNDGVDPASGSFEFGGKGTTVNTTDVWILPAIGEASAVHSGAFALAGNVGDGPNDYDPTPPDGMLYVGGPVSDSKSGFINPTFWGLGTKGFLGTSTYNIQVDASQWIDYGSGGGNAYPRHAGHSSGLLSQK